jgi:type III secretory pathway component EscR
VSVFDRISKVINTPYAKEKYMKMKLEELINKEHDEVIKIPLKDFLKEADEVGYNYFFKDIIKKVIIARLQKKGLLDEYNNT